MRKYKFYFILGFLALIFSIVYNLYFSPEQAYSKSANKLLVSSTMSQVGYDIAKQLGKVTGSNFETTDNFKNKYAFQIKYKSEISEMDKHDYEIIEVTEDYIVLTANVEKKMVNLGNQELKAIDGNKSDLSKPVTLIGTNDAADYANEYIFGKPAVYKMSGEYIKDNVSKDGNFMGFTYASQYVYDWKVRPVKIDNKSIFDSNYPFKDKICLLIDKEVSTKDKIIAGFKEFKYKINTRDIEYPQ